MHPYRTVTIVGVGLLGGSIGMALRERQLAQNVVGVGRRTSSLEQALANGSVDSVTTDVAEGVAEADLVIICTPVELIVPHVREIAAAAPEGVLLTDVGSIKAGICQQLSTGLPSGAKIIRSHPLAGSEKSGPEHARADLLVDRVVVITPTDNANHSAVEQIRTLWQALGATCVSMSPTEHDAAVAMTSHLPHLLAAALAGATPAEMGPLVATGWRDTTRIAAGDAQLWRQILMGNRSHTLKAVEKFEKVLSSFKEALTAGDHAQLLSLLEAGKQARDTLGS
jgi:prephenate dehydrogenase